MSRALSPLPVAALSLLLVAALAVAGCTSSPPPQPVKKTPPRVITADAGLQSWLKVQAEVAALDIDQLNSALGATTRPDTADGLFYYALLNQRAQTFNAWALARDVLRQLQQDESLSLQQHQLAGMLEAYNQSRLNWSQRYDQLQGEYNAQQQQLLQLEQDNALLEQKIQAITDLEATISERKEP